MDRPHSVPPLPELGPPVSACAIAGRRDGVPIAGTGSRFLPADGWTLRTAADWCYAVPSDYPFLRQGWKLHVSATPLSALLVLSRCARVLVAQGCAFKFAPNLPRLLDLPARGSNLAAAPGNSSPSIRIGRRTWRNWPKCCTRSRPACRARRFCPIASMSQEASSTSATASTRRTRR